MALYLAERLYSKKAQLVYSFQLDQLVTGSDVAQVYSVTLDVPRLVCCIVLGNGKPLASKLTYDAIDLDLFH